MATKKQEQYYEFTDDDLGTWIDGAYGSEHAVEKMMEMLGDLGTQRADNLLDEYDDEEIEDAEEFFDEWLNDATEALQEVTAPGLVWEWDAGDLVLRETEED